MKYHPQHKILKISKNELGLNSASNYLSGRILNDHLAIIIITDTSEGLYITDFTDTTFQYYLNTANHRLLVKLPQICFVLFLVCVKFCL